MPCIKTSSTIQLLPPINYLLPPVNFSVPPFNLCHQSTSASIQLLLLIFQLINQVYIHHQCHLVPQSPNSSSRLLSTTIGYRWAVQQLLPTFVAAACWFSKMPMYSHACYSQLTPTRFMSSSSLTKLVSARLGMQKHTTYIQQLETSPFHIMSWNRMYPNLVL